MKRKPMAAARCAHSAECTGTGMRFRPCIDIHNGAVKQIVGGSLKDVGDKARENFVSEKDAAFLPGFTGVDG